MKKTSKTTSTTHNSANGHYINEQRLIQMHLTRIQEGLNAHAKKQQAQPFNWGYASELEDFRKALKELDDQINRTGEYAPENITPVRGAAARLTFYRRDGKKTIITIPQD